MIKNKKYKVILIDIDDTLLDFDKAETSSIIECLNQYDIKYSEEAVKKYKEINLDHWHMFENGLTTIPELMVNRFKVFLGIYKPELVDHANEFNNCYLSRLNEKNDIIDGADVVIKELLKGYVVIPASNGVGETQVKRLETSLLQGLFKKYYISGFIGYQKPQKEFFDYIFKDLDSINKQEILMIGDSLSSDIQGGINAGIDTCWFNYRNKDIGSYKPTYVINSLLDLLTLLTNE